MSEEKKYNYYDKVSPVLVSKDHKRDLTNISNMLGISQKELVEGWIEKFKKDGLKQAMIARQNELMKMVDSDQDEKVVEKKQTNTGTKTSTSKK